MSYNKLKRVDMNTRELVEMLDDLASRDLAEGTDIVDHPAHIAAIKLIELETLETENLVMVTLLSGIAVGNNSRKDAAQYIQSMLKGLLDDSLSEEGYQANQNCKSCNGMSWLAPSVCDDCNPKGIQDKSEPRIKSIACADHGVLYCQLCGILPK